MLWIGEKSCSGTGVTKLGSLACSSSTVFITELGNELFVIDVVIGCLAEGLGSSRNNAFVAFVETIEKHRCLNFVTDCSTRAAKLLDMGVVGVKIMIHRISLELRFSVVSKLVSKELLPKIEMSRESLPFI